MPAQKTEIIIKPIQPFSLGIKELWDYRELFYFFTWRDIKVKYKQTFLGFLWVILQPLLLVGVFVAFFSKALHITTNNVPSPLFYYIGLMVWHIFSAGLSGAADSMLSNAGIIKKVYFPRLIIPISTLLVAFFDFLMTFIVFLLFLIYYILYKNIYYSLFQIIACLFVAVLIVSIFSLGMGLILSALNVKYRDFRYILPFFIQFFMFLSPIMYASSVYSKMGWLGKIAALNPLASAIELARAPFTQQPIDWFQTALATVIAITTLFVGIYTFRRTESYFADLA